MKVIYQELFQTFFCSFLDLDKKKTFLVFENQEGLARIKEL